MQMVLTIISTHPDIQPKVLNRFEPWFPLFFFEGSIGGDIESVSTRGIRDFYGENNSTALAEYVKVDAMGEEPKGSNGLLLPVSILHQVMPCYSLIHTLLSISEENLR